MTFSAFVILAITAFYFLFGVGILIAIVWKSRQRDDDVSQGKEIGR